MEKTFFRLRYGERMRNERKHYTADEKVAILRRHLLDKVPVSDLCEELGLRPTVFYRWQKEFFENGSAAFQSKERPARQVEEKQKRIEFLEKKVQTKDEVLAELMAEHSALKKKSWGTLTKSWVAHDVRDQVVDFVRRWSEKTEIGVGRFPPWLGVTASKFYDWRQRYGRVNEHNGWIPRDFWLEAWEKEAIIDFHQKNPLQQAGLLSRWKSKPSRKGTGFEQPQQPHQHWHIDVSYINVSGTFYYLCSVLDGYSRFLVHWGLRESMKEADIEMILERAKEKYPEAKPRIISDNGPQFVARDFKEFIRISGMTHVRTSPFAVEREDRTLAQVAQTGVHPAPYPVDAGRCAPPDSNLRGSLQHGATAQRHRLCDAAGYARRATGRDLRGSRSQVRRGS